MARIFQESFFRDFWDESDYTYRDYTGSAVTKEQIRHAEETLGYKLPQSYIELLGNRNGGVPINTCFPTQTRTSWAEDHIEISAILGINNKNHSLLGMTGSRFMLEEWGYPDIGIVICDSQSAGHDAVMLDYRKCGREGEPAVVHVDVEGDAPGITFLAANFELFVRNLINESVYTAPLIEEGRRKALDKVAHGSFSPVLLKAFEKVKHIMPDADGKLRRLGREIVDAKQEFILQGDDLSYLVYAYLFWLFSHIQTPRSKEDYLGKPDKYKPLSYDAPYYALMIASDYGREPYGFLAEGSWIIFLGNWWRNRLDNGELIETSEGFTFSKDAENRLFEALAGLEKGIIPKGEY